MCFYLFFFNDTATTEIYTLSLHDALPIFGPLGAPAPEDGDEERSDEQHGRGDPELPRQPQVAVVGEVVHLGKDTVGDRKSTRLNSSHANISYAVFCLKKKKYHHPPSVALR